jgi:hypothetical protein
MRALTLGMAALSRKDAKREAFFTAPVALAPAPPLEAAEGKATGGFACQ